MSAYFDEKAQQLRVLVESGATPAHDAVRAWVRALTLDIAICCEYDRAGPLAFPADLRDQAYALFLRCSPEAWPCGVPGYGVDYEYDHEGMALLSNLVEGLHDIFHAAAHAGWPGRDNPRSAVTAMDGLMEERCAALIAADPTLTKGTFAPPPVDGAS